MAFIKTRKKIVSSAIVSSLSVMAGQAVAQDNVTQLATIQTKADADQGFKVDKSANSKFVAPLLDTAKSVSIISKQLIEDTQVTTLADALRTVPGITLGAGEGGNPNGDRPFIRGYSSESSMYVDGVRNASSQNREMFAIEQVEVTKGSSSVMGGGGSVGGNINIISKLPKKGDSLEGTIAAGTDNYQRITLDGNKDFGNGIAARVAVLGHHNEKAGQHNGAEYSRVGIAPSVTFGMDTPNRATLSYYYLQSDDTPDAGIPYNNPNNTTGRAGHPIDVKPGTYYGWRDRDFQRQENHIATMKLEHDFDNGFTVSNTAVYSKSKNNYVWTQPDDSTGNFVDPTTGNLKDTGIWRRANTRITDTRTFTDQLALTGKFDTGFIKHSINMGAEFSRAESDKGSYNVKDDSVSDTSKTACSVGIAASNGWCASTFNPNAYTPFNGTITANAKATTTTSENTGIYFLDHMELSKQWLLDFGMRWDNFDSKVVYNKATTGRNPVPAGSKFNASDDFFSWNGGLTFKPTENGSIYFNYASSTNPIGVDQGDGTESIGTAQRQNELKPESAQTFEIGTKWDLFNDRLNATAAIFHTKKKNTRIEVEPGLTTNAGESEVDGVELGLNGKITDKWDIALGYTYLDSELTKAAYNATNEGKRLANVPRNSATLWTTYQVLPKLQLGFGALGMDKVYGSSNDGKEKYVPGYVRFDAMARYDVNKDVNVQLNYNNLGNRRYFTKAYASHYATEAEGANAVLAINFKY
jgi:catecholate siderophore receptor